MTIAISPNDFGDDISSSITPILNLLGLIGEDGSINLNDWDIKKAFGFFKSYDKTEALLDLVSSLTGNPSTSVYRQKDYTPNGQSLTISGLLEEIVTDGGNYFEEEWFKIFSPALSSGDLSINVVTIHERNDPGHTLNLGLGIDFDIQVGAQELNGRISIPLFQISCLDGENVSSDRLIWADTDSSESRISLNLSLRNENGDPFAITNGPSCASFSLNVAFGTSGAKVVLSLDDYIAAPGGTASSFVIDSWGGAGMLSDFAEGIIPALLGQLGTDSILYKNLLPMLGIRRPDISLPAGVDWPTIDIVGILSDLSNPELIISDLKNWLFDMLQPEIIENWLALLFSMLVSLDILDSGTLSGILSKISGDIFSVDTPLKLQLYDHPPLDFNANISLCLREDGEGINWLDVGADLSFGHDIDTNVSLNGGFEIQILSIPFSALNSISLVPRITTELYIQHPSWVSESSSSTLPPHPLIVVDPVGGSSGQPLDNLNFLIDRIHLALSMDSNYHFTPILELLHFSLGNVDSNPYEPTSHWDIFDLTTLDSAQDLIESVLQGVSDTISDYLADGGILQWVGSLFGLVSPRSGDFRDDWEGVTGTDLRVDLVELVTSPLCSIVQYHTNLMGVSFPNPSGGDDVCAWSYVFEAFGHIFQSGINSIAGDSLPAMQSDFSLATPNQYSFTPAGAMPAVLLNAVNEENTEDTNVYDTRFSIELILNQFEIRENLALKANLVVDLLDIHLPKPGPICDSCAEFLPSISLKATLGDIGDGSQERVNLLNYAGFNVSFLQLSGGLYWSQSDGISWSFDLEEPIIGVAIPDIAGLYAHINTNYNLPGLPDFDFSLLTDFNWDGFCLKLPNGLKFYPFENFFSGGGGNGGFSFPDIEIRFPEFPEFPDLPSLPSFSFDLSWDFEGMNCPKISFGSLNGLSGLFGNNSSGGGGGMNLNLFDFDFSLGNWNPLDLLTLPSLRIFIGQLFAMKGGRWGLFFSTFFRLNPHLIHLDLGFHLSKFNVNIPDVSIDLPDWPSGWSSARNRSSNQFGLGPFALPFDWPEIDWNLLLENPWFELKKFFVNLFSGTSSSGEPFAMPALRWLWGLFSGGLPNLSLPDLGWGSGESNEFEFPEITLPDVPITIVGDGTYHNPWAITLTPIGLPKVELLVWVDPDGLPGGNILDYATSMLADSVLEMFDTVIDSQVAALVMNDNWHQSLAGLIYRLGQMSPRIGHAINGMSVEEIGQLLLNVDQFLKNTDGLSSTASQSDATGDWADESNSQLYLANHLTALRSDEVISDAISFISEVKELDELINVKILLAAPPWMSNELLAGGSDPWADVMTALQSNFGAAPAPLLTSHAIDLDVIGVSSLASLSAMDLSVLANMDVVKTTVGLAFGTDGTPDEIMAKQLEVITQAMINNVPNTKVFIIGHSIAGVAVNRYTSGLLENTPGMVPDDIVAGALTIATPHMGFDLPEQFETAIDAATHLFELIGAIQRGGVDLDTFDDLISNEDWMNNAFLSQLLSFFNKAKEKTEELLGGVMP